MNRASGRRSPEEHGRSEGARDRNRWRVVVGGVVGVVVLISTAVAVGAPQRPTVVTESGTGTYVGDGQLPYWVWAGTDLRLAPSGLANASTAVGTPTLLPGTVAGGAPGYQAPGTGSGSSAVRWSFVLTTRAPIHAEVELRLVAGGGPAVVPYTIYFETPLTPVLVSMPITVYANVGSAGGAGFTIQSWDVTVLACPALGQCP